MGREREQNRIFCDTRTEEEEDRGGIGHSSKLMPFVLKSSKQDFVYARTEKKLCALVQQK